MEGTRSMGESLVRAPSGPGAARADGGALVARVLGAAGVRHLFTVNGGHIWPILAHLREHGVQMIHMRHEQSCAYAADGYARTSGRPGVLSVTAGCGLTNAVTGLCVAGLAGRAGDPAAIDRALDAIARAERPLVVAGDGVFWSDAAADLLAFATRLEIPVYTRRAAQGAVPEDHPLAVRGAWKKPFTGRADVVLSVGFRFWSGEHFGREPTWSESATHVQIDSSPTRIGAHVPAEVAIVGDPKLVLRQIIDG